MADGRSVVVCSIVPVPSGRRVTSTFDVRHPATPTEQASVSIVLSTLLFYRESNLESKIQGFRDSRIQGFKDE
jgi:hypothetical protein